MTTALERLKKGVAKQPTSLSALDRLRQGITTSQKPSISLETDFFGTQTTTPTFIPPKPPTLTEEERKAQIERAKEARIKPELITEVEKAERERERPLFGLRGRFPEEVRQQVKEIGQSIARSFLVTGQTLADIPKIVSKIEDKPEGTLFQDIKKAIGEVEFEPKAKFEVAIAGTEEPVSFESIGEETLSIFGEEFAQKHKGLALPAGLLIAGLDITPFGRSKKGALEALKGANKVGDAIKVLTKLGVTDDVARQFADDVVKTKTDDAATKLFDQIAKTQMATKVTPEVAPKVVKPKIIRPLEVDSVRAVGEEIIPPLPVPPVKAIHPFKKLTSAIKATTPLTKEQKALRKLELKKRVGAIVGIGKKREGERGFWKQLSKLKGELPKKDFEAIRNVFSQAEIDSLYNFIEDTKLTPLEKISVKSGLLRLFEGSLPRQHELKLFKEIFPDELMKAISDKRTLSQKIFATLGQVINTPRAIMASVDLSAPLRQGIFMIGRPKGFLEAFGNMFRYAFSEKAYKGLEEAIKKMDTYQQMREAKLAFTRLGADLTSREEVIMSNLPERIPLLGRVFRGSNRAYTGFLNKLRADVFNDIVKKAGVAGKELTNDDLRSLGKFINAATGRGDLGVFNRATVPLNALFFSPRLLASRINLLNPYFYITLSPIARKEALKTGFASASIAGTILALAKMGGAEVEHDPRNADFGKIKIGNTRYDILGGFQQPIRLVAQLVMGEIISSTTGRTITLGEGYKPLTRKDILLRFFEYKESPIASFGTGMLQGTTPIGEKFDVPTEVINRFIPMVMQDMYDLSQERGAEGLMMALPAIFGVGVQTYGKQEVVYGISPIGEPTAQIRPIPELADKIRELVLGQLPLDPSRRFSIEAYFDQMSNLPREEAAEVFDKIAETNPDLAKKIQDIVKERELGITVKDKDIKSKGVSSGERAMAVKEKMDDLKTKEEKADLWDDYVKKGIITKEVARQLKILMKD